MSLVLDVSGVISLAFDDEDSTYAESVLVSPEADRLVVPSLFWFEIRNALLMGERQGRIDQVRTQAFLADLGLLTFTVDHSPDEATVLDLARQHTLTVYDAAYLELAQRLAIPLATSDRELIAAAAQVGVTVWRA